MIAAINYKEQQILMDSGVALPILMYYDEDKNQIKAEIGNEDAPEGAVKFVAGPYFAPNPKGPSFAKQPQFIQVDMREMTVEDQQTLN